MNLEKDKTEPGSFSNQKTKNSIIGEITKIQFKRFDSSQI
jgi:hypothetical protein